MFCAVDMVTTDRDQFLLRSTCQFDLGEIEKNTKQCIEERDWMVGI